MRDNTTFIYKDKNSGIDLNEVKRIVSLNMDICYESYPCDHHVMVEMNDNRMLESNYFNGPEILVLLEKTGYEIKADEKSHFECYKNHPRYSELSKLLL